MRVTSFALLLGTAAFLANAAPEPSAVAAVGEHLAGVRDSSEERVQDAETHYRNALATWDALAPAYPRLHAITLISLADLLAVSGRMPEAKTLLDRAVVIAEPLEQSAPGVLASVNSHLGAYYGRTEQPERGRPLLNDAIRRFSRIGDADAGEVAYAYNALGMIDLSSGKYADGEVNLQQAVTRAAQSLGETHPETLGYQTNFAFALYFEGHFNRAETLLRRARALSRGDSVQSAAILSELAAVETALGKFGTAENLTEQALAVLSRTHAQNSVEVTAVKVNLGALYLREHKLSEAARILPEAVRLERTLPIDPRLRADGIRRLADLRAQQHNWLEAEALYRESIAIYQERLGAEHPDIAPIRREYALVIKHTKGRQS